MSDNRGLDSLWERGQTSPTTWFDSLDVDQQQWLRDIAKEMVVRGEGPTWSRVVLAFKAEWPETKVCARDTMKTTLIRLAEDG